MDPDDFLDEIVQERTVANSEFSELVEAAERRRLLIRELNAQRERTPQRAEP